jgi:hypothetical protein
MSSCEHHVSIDTHIYYYYSSALTRVFDPSFEAIAFRYSLGNQRNPPYATGQMRLQRELPEIACDFTYTHNSRCVCGSAVHEYLILITVHMIHERWKQNRREATRARSQNYLIFVVGDYVRISAISVMYCVHAVYFF